MQTLPQMRIHPFPKAYFGSGKYQGPVSTSFISGYGANAIEQQELNNWFTTVYYKLTQLKKPWSKPKSINGLPLIWEPSRNRGFSFHYHPLEGSRGNPGIAALIPAKTELNIKEPIPKAFVSMINESWSSDRTAFTLIKTDNGIIYASPSNSFVHTIKEYLNRNGVAFKEIPIDLKKVDRLLAWVKGQPQPVIHQGWAGRDVLAPIVAAVLAGLAPETFRAEKPHETIGEVSSFIQSSTPFESLHTGQQINCEAFVSPPFGDVMLSIPYQQRDIHKILQADPRFEIQYGDIHFRDVPLRENIQAVGDGEPVLVLSSTQALDHGRNWLEFAIRNRNAANAFGFPEKVIQVQNIKLTKTS